MPAVANGRRRCGGTWQVTTTTPPAGFSTSPTAAVLSKRTTCNVLDPSTGMKGFLFFFFVFVYSCLCFCFVFHQNNKIQHRKFVTPSVVNYIPQRSTLYYYRLSPGQRGRARAHAPPPSRAAGARGGAPRGRRLAPAARRHLAGTSPVPSHRFPACTAPRVRLSATACHARRRLHSSTCVHRHRARHRDPRLSDACQPPRAPHAPRRAAAWRWTLR